MQLCASRAVRQQDQSGVGLIPAQALLRTFNFELQAAATDNGILISLTEGHAFRWSWFLNS